MKKILRIENLGSQFLLFASILILSLAAIFLLSNNIATKILIQHTNQSGEKLLYQVHSKAEEICHNSCNTFTALLYSPTIQNYLNADEAQHVLQHKDVLSVLSNARLIQPGMEGAAIYGKDQNLLVSYGDNRDFPENLKGNVEQIVYSNLLTGEKSQPYYTIIIPIFSLTGSTYKNSIGFCMLKMGIDELENILEHSLVTETAQMIITDRNGQIIASTRGENSGQIYTPPVEENGQLLKQQDVETAGWKIISLIPEEEIRSQMNTLQIFNLITYIIIFVFASTFILLCYHRIIKPINKLQLFVQNHLQHPQARILLPVRNELQQLASDLNSMLDEKERMNREVKSMKEQMYLLELSQKQAELLAYRSQINPHFLYNTLECIQSMALCHDMEDIAGITLSLSNMFRYAVRGSHLVTLEKEIAHIREYANIIDCRFMGQIKIVFQIADDARHILIFRLLLQPFVENAVFHGLECCSYQGLIEVSAKCLDDSILNLKIKDNGCGIQPQILQNIRENWRKRSHLPTAWDTGQNIGMQNIFQRLFLIYGNEASFEIESQPEQGTEIIIQFPILEKEEFKYVMENSSGR